VLEEARLEGKSLEELVGEALFKQLEVTDLEAKAELHPRFCEKYVRGAAGIPRKEGLAQASGKRLGRRILGGQGVSGLQPNPLYPRSVEVPVLTRDRVEPVPPNRGRVQGVLKPKSTT